MLVTSINTVSGQLLVMSYEPYITHYTRQTYVHTNIHTTMTQHIVNITLHITLDRHTYIQTYIQQ